jgi:hypothetical protein
MNVSVRRILIDALKPHEISIVDLSKRLCEIDGVDGVDVMVTEVDAETETVKISIVGPDIDYEAVRQAIDEYGLAIRSIDEVSVAKTRGRRE